MARAKKVTRKKREKSLRIKTIVYARIKNLGNYQNERVEASAEINANDCVKTEMERLKKWVNVQLGLDENPSRAEYQRAKAIVDKFEENDEFGF